MGLNWHDYGWRNYDATLGRWMNIDPLSEEFYGASPYNYVGNDPIGQADMDGRDFRIDVIRDKDNNITGLKFSSTVYIQGSGASTERANDLNKEFKNNYGGSKKVDGINVSVDVNYVYDQSKTKGDLKGDENLLAFSAEPEGGTMETTSGVRGNVGTIFGSGERNQTIFHESFHFMGLSDRYDDYRGGNFYFDGTLPNTNFDKDDIMNNGTFKLSKAHYENWVKHAKMRASLGPIKWSPFNPISNMTESYIESSINKIDSKNGKLQNPKTGAWYKRINYNE